MWLLEAKRKGLKFYVSDKTIGKIFFEESSWFTGYDEKFFYAKGAYYAAVHPKTLFLWKYYFSFRTKHLANIPLKEKLKWMKFGVKGYHTLKSYGQFLDDMADRGSK